MDKQYIVIIKLLINLLNYLKKDLIYKLIIKILLIYLKRNI